eukprot:15452606-Alexandrium_andersonii.AAC.1
MEAAFTSENIKGSRWLLGGRPSRGVCSSPAWDQMLHMTPEKQVFFMKRVLHVYLVENGRRTSSKQVLRMDSDRWEKEANLCCMAEWGLSALCANVDPSDPSTPMIPSDKIAKLRMRIIEGCLWPRTLACTGVGLLQVAVRACCRSQRVACSRLGPSECGCRGAPPLLPLCMRPV